MLCKHEPRGEGFSPMKGKRRWIGRRVWVAVGDGKRPGTLWWDDEATVLIREDGPGRSRDTSEGGGALGVRG